MTHIVGSGIKTKKELAAIVANILTNGAQVNLTDPSIHNPRDVFITESQGALITNLNDGETIYCTNHPKRSWFAKVTRRGGRVVVK